MVQIRENMQKQLTARYADTQLLRTDPLSGILRMFAGLTNLLWVKETAP